MKIIVFKKALTDDALQISLTNHYLLISEIVLMLILLWL